MALSGGAGLGRAAAPAARAASSDGDADRWPALAHLQSPAARRGRRRGRSVLRATRGRARAAVRQSSRVDVAALRARAAAFDRGRGAAARYAFLEDAAAIGSAPTRSPSATPLDDQAETFLLAAAARLPARAGSRRIRPRAGRVIRPLLDVARADLRAYLARRGAGVPRRRVERRRRASRATGSGTSCIPYLESRFSPGDHRCARARGGARAAGRRISSQRSNRIGPIGSS